MQKNETEFLWTEKYRPAKLDDIILPSELKSQLKAFVAKGELPNLMFAGGAGIGKTTVARALCNELNLDHIFINASEESGIDVLRNKIKSFASTVSFSSSYKVVILDEADHLNPTSTQPALRGFIEEFSKNCRFIFTANFKNKIIDPLHSRCTVVDFKFNRKTQMPELMGAFYKRASAILDSESITYDKKILATLIASAAPDWRKVLGNLQQHSISGKLDGASIQAGGAEDIDGLIKLLKARDFPAMRKWVGESLNNDPTEMIRKIYDGANKYCKKESIPQLILILADYQYKNSFVADHELNIVAMLTEMMGNCEFN